MVMVFVPVGEFQMGSTDEEVDEVLQVCNVYLDGNCKREWIEVQQPLHTVALDGFWIDQTEVTNAQYGQCVEAGACRTPTTCGGGGPTYGDASKADHPVVCVSWHGAQAYCEWAGARLPTEAEWEYVARGPQGFVYPWGNEFDGTRLNYCDVNCTSTQADTDYDDGYEGSAPVGSFQNGASWCGALDMAGNVMEWVADWYDGDYYDNSPSQNPTGPPSGRGRGVRGGAWYYEPYLLRSSYRLWHSPGDTYDVIGFRCVMNSE
jgi:formylglycine-generating enzyme required for sulfatase activity